MLILRVVGVGLLGVLLATMLRRNTPELYFVILLATGVAILAILLSSMSGAINSFASLMQQAGVDQSLFAGVLKIIGIGYITEYAASMCRDADAASVADKIQLGGKITVFLMGLPIVTTLVQTLSSLLT